MDVNMKSRGPRIAALFASMAVSLLSSGCAVLGTVQSARQFDYEDRVVGLPPVKGLVLALRKSEANPQVVRVMLKNAGEHAVCVNGRLVLDFGQFDAPANLNFVVARESNGERLQLRAKRMTRGTGSISASSYKLLEPNEYLVSDVSLEWLYELDPRESYRVYAEYSNQESGFEARGRWVEKNAWVGQLRSNSVVVQPAR